MVTLGTQSVTFEVLQTVLVEIEGIFELQTIGISSSDASDLTPLLQLSPMGRPDASLPPDSIPRVRAGQPTTMAP